MKKLSLLKIANKNKINGFTSLILTEANAMSL